jgi:hypothetical protein
LTSESRFCPSAASTGRGEAGKLQHGRVLAFAQPGERVRGWQRCYSS